MCRSEIIMNKYEKAMEYLFSAMERGNIKNDEEQEVFEIAIEALTKVKDSTNEEYKNPNFKYGKGDILPNEMKIISHRLFAKNDPRYVLERTDKKIVIITEKEIDDIMTEFYESK
jgi:hypothetical protein